MVRHSSVEASTPIFLSFCLKSSAPSLTFMPGLYHASRGPAEADSLCPPPLGCQFLTNSETALRVSLYVPLVVYVR